MKRALIAGITGQDGSYLAEFLLDKDYEVHGIVRRNSNGNLDRISHIADKLNLHYGDLSDSSGIGRIVKTVCPDEVYNLAAQSQVYISFEIPEYTADINGLGALRLLDTLKEQNKNAKYFQAVSSEIFGNTSDIPQTESTRLNPKNSYGVSKLFAYYTVKNYRDNYGMFACNGIMYNHESPRRSDNFVTKKIVKAVAAIAAGEQNELYLGNIEDKRDWGYAKDYVEAMWLMLQHNIPDDYIISSNSSYSVRDFLDEAFRLVNLDWHDYIKTDSKLLRSLDKRDTVFMGDNSKIYKNLGWKPKTSFKELVRIMLEDELKKKNINL